MKVRASADLSCRLGTKSQTFCAHQEGFIQAIAGAADLGGGVVLVRFGEYPMKAVMHWQMQNPHAKDEVEGKTTVQRIELTYSDGSLWPSGISSLLRFQKSSPARTRREKFKQILPESRKKNNKLLSLLSAVLEVGYGPAPCWRQEASEEQEDTRPCTLEAGASETQGTNVGPRHAMHRQHFGLTSQSVTSTCGKAATRRLRACRLPLPFSKLHRRLEMSQESFLPGGRWTMV